MELTNADIKSAQKVFDAYLDYRKSDEEHVSYTQWFKKIRHSYPDARQNKGSAEQQPITQQGSGPSEICSDNICDYCKTRGTCTLRVPCNGGFTGRKLLPC